MNSKLINKIWNSLETTPGVINFSSIEKDEILNDIKKSSDAIFIEKIKDAKYDVKIALIIDRNVATNNFSKQVFDLISFIFKKENLVLNKLDVYIKGVK